MNGERVHLFHQCWCGSGHDWEKAKHGTVNGLTEEQIAELVETEKWREARGMNDRWM